MAGHIGGKIKAVLKEAEKVENAQARKNALSAAVSMDMAERLYNSRQILGERQATTHAMSRQSKQSGFFRGQPQQNNVASIGRKRGIDEAFPKHDESETTVV